METLPHELQTRVLYYALDEAWTLGHICPTLGEALLEERFDMRANVAVAVAVAAYRIPRLATHHSLLAPRVAPVTYREFLNDSKPNAEQQRLTLEWAIVWARVKSIEQNRRLPPLNVLRALTATSHALRDAFMPFWCDIHRQIAAEFLSLDVVAISDVTPRTALLAINSLDGDLPPLSRIEQTVELAESETTA